MKRKSTGKSATVCECNGYRVINYVPFACTQNLNQNYAIMVQIFLCEAEGELMDQSNESIHLRWVPLRELKRLLKQDETRFYPMHITTLEKYPAQKDMKI